MSKIWDQSAIQQYIDNESQESLILEYKAASALDKSPSKKAEITKDVSAMANSSGGTIIYGVEEYGGQDKKHLPEKIDPIEQDIFTKEWLEQVINNIRPRIDGLVIHSVPLDTTSNHVAYVVEIPQSTTAHQATDKKYYKRFNFQAVPMEDYEIRDTMGRQQHPKIDLDFEIEVTNDYFGCTLKVIAHNVGGVYAQYVNSFIRVPLLLLDQASPPSGETIEEDGQEYYKIYKVNTVQDIVDMKTVVLLGTSVAQSPSTRPKYGPARYDPILPGLSRTWEIELRRDLEQVKLDGLAIKWAIYADNAPAQEGTIPVTDIRIVRRKLP